MKFESRMDICGHAVTATDGYTSFSHSKKQTMLPLYWQHYL